MRLLAGGAPDQYHAFTTRLSASGYQTTTMRVVGGCILFLGLPALLAGIAPAVTPWPGFRMAYSAIALACVVLALPWFRYRWPTRRESAAVVLAGTLALAGGCLATVDPLAGMVIASAFLLPLGFTALFHSSRLLVFVLTVTAVTVAWLATRITIGDSIATAVAVTLPIVLLSVIVTYGLRTIATVGGSDETRAELDPVTGLLTRESFYERASTLIGARNRTDDRFLALAVIAIDGLAAIAGIQGARGETQVRIAVGQALRETVRHDAVLGHLDESEFLVADTFTTPDPAPLIERMRGAIATTPSGITASIGVVSTPMRPLASRPPYEVLDGVIAMAAEAMAGARRGGGNQARYLLDVDLHLSEERGGDGA